jgi:hypothetical protein
MSQDLKNRILEYHIWVVPWLAGADLLPSDKENCTI